MSTALQTLDVTESSELLDLAEEVQRTGVGRLLIRGDEELAQITPVASRPSSHSPQPAEDDGHDTLLHIIGLGASAEPTDIARNKQEYLAEAYAPTRK